MIITEIKHLNVRISVFEDPIFDANILPIFTTPLILKEVAARKKSKYKIETLNPEKKLTFKVVSFYEIVEELAARIDKIAIDLEPHYFIDPSDFNSLPYKVRQNLENKNLIDETKEIEEAVLRITSSTVKGKRLILYAQHFRYYRRYRKGLAVLSSKIGRPVKAGSGRSIFSYKARVLQKLQHSYNKGQFILEPLTPAPIIKITKQNLFKYRDGAEITFNKIVNLLRDFKILTNFNKKNELLTINQESGSVATSTANQARPSENKVKKANTLFLALPKKAQQTPKAGESITDLSTTYVGPTGAAVKKKIKKSYDKILFRSGWIPTSKGALMILDDEGWDLNLLLNINSLRSPSADLRDQRLRKKRPYKLRKLRRLRRLRRLRLMSINLYLHRSKNVERIQKDQECQGRNHSTLINGAALTNLPKPDSQDAIQDLQLWLRNKLGTTANLYCGSRPGGRVKTYKAFNNNKYLIKHNDNKLKFIVNWVGGNLSKKVQQQVQVDKAYIDIANIMLLKKEVVALPSKSADSTVQPRNALLNGSLAIQRLNKTNITDIFLKLQSQPVQLPLLEDKADPVSENNNQSDLQQLQAQNPKASAAKATAKTSRSRLRIQPTKRWKAAPTKYRNFSTFATSITTISSIANPDQILKVLAQYRAVSNAAPYSLDPSVNQGESSSASGLVDAETNHKVSGALPAKNRKKNATTTTPVSLNAHPSLPNVRGVNTNKPAKGVKKGGKSAIPANFKERELSPVHLGSGLDGPAFSQGRAEKQTLNLSLPVKPASTGLKPATKKEGGKHLPALALQQQNSLALRLKLSNTRRKDLEKKKDLSVNLLYKTNLSFVKAILRRKNIFLEDNFTAYLRQVKKRSIFKNNNFYNDYNVTANRDIKLLLKSNLKKIRTSAAAEPVAWKKINTLLNSSSPRLFWEIIKLYSSSFNPMLNNLNNKLQRSTILFGKGTAAQLQFLKNSAGPVNAVQESILPAINLLSSSASRRPEAEAALPKLGVANATTKEEFSIKALPSQRAEQLISLLLKEQEDSRNNISTLQQQRNTGRAALANPVFGKTKPAKGGQSRMLRSDTQLDLTTKVKVQGSASEDIRLLTLKSKQGAAKPAEGERRQNKIIPSLTSTPNLQLSAVQRLMAEKHRHTVNIQNKDSVSTALPSKYKLFAATTRPADQIKKKVLKFLQFGLADVQPGLPHKKKTALQFPVRARWQADNKRFLFLYFIVPIFFATLKNSTAALALTAAQPAKEQSQPSLKALRSQSHRDKILNNQNKQLRSLIKLMLDTGSVVRSKWQSRKARLIKAALPLLQTYVSGNSLLEAAKPRKGQKVALPNIRTDAIKKGGASLADKYLPISSQLHNLSRKNLNLNQEVPTTVSALSTTGQLTGAGEAAAVQAKALQSYNKTTKINKTKVNASPKSAKLSLTKDINYFIKSLNLNTLKSRAKADFTSNLLKWSILFIAQSLAPLKRKHEYYSLIFIKILETRGMVGLPDHKAGLPALALDKTKTVAASPLSPADKVTTFNLRKNLTALALPFGTPSSIKEKAKIKGKNKAEPAQLPVEELTQIKSNLESLIERDFNYASPHLVSQADKELSETRKLSKKGKGIGKKESALYNQALLAKQSRVLTATQSIAIKADGAVVTAVAEQVEASAQESKARQGLDRKNFAVSLTKQTGLTELTKVVYTAQGVASPLATSNTENNKLSNKKDAAATSMAELGESAKKQASITFYPGGRFLSDWKRVTKVIWQEEYKFNTVYCRVKNSLSLANNNIDKNLKNWYTIITIFRLWNIIKITTIKSIFSFKLQVLFVKLPTILFFDKIRRSSKLNRLFNGYKIYMAKLAALLPNQSHMPVQQLYHPSLARLAPNTLTFAAAAAAIKIKRSSIKNKKQRQRLRRRIKNSANSLAWRIEKILSEPLQLIIKKLEKKQKNKLQLTDLILKENVSQINYLKKLKFLIINSILNILERIPATGQNPVGGEAALRTIGALNSSPFGATVAAQQGKFSQQRQLRNDYHLAGRTLPVPIRAALIYMAKLISLDENLFHKLLTQAPGGITYIQRVRSNPYFSYSNTKRRNKINRSNKASRSRRQQGFEIQHSLVYNLVGGRRYAPFVNTFTQLLLWVKLQKSCRLIPNYTSLKNSLANIVKKLYSHVPFIFSIYRLLQHPNIKLNFINKDIFIPVASAARARNKQMTAALTIALARRTNKRNIKKDDSNKAIALTALQTIEAKLSEQTEGLLQPRITDGEAINLNQNIEFIKSFNNLVNAKSTIIGKIRSIKIVELIDKLKEDIIIAEQLAALVRVADITDLNLKNKKKIRRLNASKYLNKKKISKSNRIKILQTIKTIKTDFWFEPKLDSNSQSNIPVSLLYYSNLVPIQNLSGPVSASTQALALSSSAENSPVISAYLRELSIYNRETKGILNYFSKIIGYNFNTNTNKINSSIYGLLEASFKAMRCLISKPVFVITPDKITIQLFYFLLVTNKNQLIKIKIRKRLRNKRTRKTYNKKRLREAKKLNLFSLIEVYPKQLELLCRSLNKVFNKPVELNLIRLHYPSEDTNILVNLMGIIINKVRLFRILKKLFAGSIIKSLTKLKARKNNDISIIPAFLTGLSIKVAGRLMTEGIKPRKTTHFTRRGATASGKINYLNFARFTNKNRRGSYSITISAGQNYFK